MRAMKDSGIEWIGKIPEEWNIGKIKHIAQLNGRIGWQGLTSSEYADDGAYLVTGIDFKNGSINWDTCVHVPISRWEEAKEIQLKNDDLLITKDGTVGKVAIAKNLPGKASLNSGVLLLRVDDAGVKYYLFWVLLSDVFWKWFNYVNAGNSTIIHLYQHVFCNFTFPMPSKEVQMHIVSFLDSKCAKIDEYLFRQQQVIEKLKEYKQSVITEAVTKGLDPDVPVKDSGVEWIGRIPKTWAIIPITKLLESIVDYRGKTPNKVDDGIFLVTARNIKNGKIDYSLSQEFIAAKDYDTVMHRGFPKLGDVLFTTEAPLGEVACVDNEKVALAQRVIKFRGLDGKLLNKYLMYWIMSTGFQNFLHSISTGSTATGIKASKLFMLLIAVCNICEQRQIVSYLDTKCAAIDAAIKRKQELIDKMTEYKKSLIYEAVTGKMEV
jgi:type I restriction enzyme S subunit